MSKYIDAEHFRRWVIARWEERDTTNPYPLSGREILDQIEREEYFTADVAEVRHGRWINCGWSIKCSICDYDMPFSVRNYCPNCGSRMDLEYEE